MITPVWHLFWSLSCAGQLSLTWSGKHGYGYRFYEVQQEAVSLRHRHTRSCLLSILSVEIWASGWLICGDCLIFVLKLMISFEWFSPWMAFHSSCSITIFLLCFEVDDNMWTVVCSSFKPPALNWEIKAVFLLFNPEICFIEIFWFPGFLKDFIFCLLFVSWFDVSAHCSSGWIFSPLWTLLAFDVSSPAVFYPLAAVDVSCRLLAGWHQQEELMFRLKIC